MKTLFLLLVSFGTASAAVITVTDPATSAIPDGHSSGLVRSLLVPASDQTVTGASVNISLSAFIGDSAFLGDLYLYLSNGTHLAVLANRPGCRAGAPAGYDDNQPVNVTFAASGAEDFHNYRLSVTGSNATPLTGPLTGVWQPDGRTADPALVLDSSPRTAGLDVFAGDPAGGTWSLFAADLSSGNVHQINSWSLSLTTIPEPGGIVLLLSALALTVRRQRPAVR